MNIENLATTIHKDLGGDPQHEQLALKIAYTVDDIIEQERGNDYKGLFEGMKNQFEFVTKSLVNKNKEINDLKNALDFMQKTNDSLAKKLKK